MQTAETMFTPTTADQFRAIYPFLSQEQKDAYVASGDLRLEPEATTNQKTTGNDYSGEASLRMVYMFGTDWGPENTITPPGEGWINAPLSPGTVKAVAELVASLEPLIQEGLKALNGGVIPNFRDPLVKEPVLPVQQVDEPIMELPIPEPTEG